MRSQECFVMIGILGLISSCLCFIKGVVGIIPFLYNVYWVSRGLVILLSGSIDFLSSSLGLAGSISLLRRRNYLIFKMGMLCVIISNIINIEVFLFPPSEGIAHLIMFYFGVPSLTIGIFTLLFFNLKMKRLRERLGVNENYELPIELERSL